MNTFINTKISDPAFATLHACITLLQIVKFLMSNLPIN